jgi:FkbM family methyltransferase
MLGALVGLTGTVHAFEPVSSTYRRLVASIAMNGLQGTIQTYNLALGNKSARIEMAFELGGLNMGGAQFLVPDRILSVDTTTEFVEVRPLDELDHIAHVDFVKMDVEGAEWLVISGGLQRLSRDRPKILMEINETQLERVSGISAENLVKEISSLGYQFNDLREGGSTALMSDPIYNIRELLARTGICNVVILPED